MKSVLVFSCLVFLAFAGSNFEASLYQQVGQSCNSNGGFNITSFDVSPWPITAGTSVTITIKGTFTIATTVGQIQYGLQGGQQWNFQYQNINAPYTVGQSATFTYQVNVPQYHDTWTVRVTVHQENAQIILACWTFQFTD